jgi:hypothetical protein
MKFPSFLGYGPARHARTRQQYIVYIAMCTVLSLIVIAIAVAASFGLVIRDLDDKDDIFKPGVNIDVELISIDPVAGTFVIDIDPFFYIPGETKDCSIVRREFNFFIDENLSVNTKEKDDYIPNSDSPKEPSFQMIEYPCNSSNKQNVDTFRKTLKLFLLPPDLEGTAPRKQYGHIGSGLQAYPFDKYYAALYMYVEERLPGNTTRDTLITVDLVRGVAANFHTDFKPEFNEVDKGLLISFNVDRSVAIKVFCLAIIITNWIVSLVFLWITVACLFWKERVVKELFAIPITVLFAFSAVRGSMPGAPAGFGAFIDYVGILPNFAVLTVCSFVLILLVLIERIKTGSPEPERGSGIVPDNMTSPWQMPQPSPLPYAK